MLELERDPFQLQNVERLRNLGIKAVIFDFDDTLIYTSEIFRRFMDEYAKTTSSSIGTDYTYFKERLSVINDEEYFTSGVSPTRWKFVIDRLFLEFNQQQAILDNHSILLNIYTEKPRLREGAVQILTILKNSDFKLGLVTHANTDWTFRKLDQTGLIDYFDEITIADENKFKSKEDWQRCITSLEVESCSCLNIGDSLGGDILPSVDLGAKTIWIPSPWSIYRQGEVPEELVQMNELSNFWDAVQKLS